MPNTKSAERRMRNSARKQDRNRHVKTSLKSLEKRYDATVKAGKREDAAKAFSLVSSALDKAAKAGVIHRQKANRKKSRLAVRLAAVK
jgi:small subunit ribosomal protein S20